MKCLTLFLISLVLLFNFSNAFNNHNKVSKNKKTKNLKLKSDPSFNPLPKYWTSGYRSNISFQTNKKHNGYLKRLAGVHKYSDTTDRVLRKAAKGKRKF